MRLARSGRSEDQHVFTSLQKVAFNQRGKLLVGTALEPRAFKLRKGFLTRQSGRSQEFLSPVLLAPDEFELAARPQVRFARLIIVAKWASTWTAYSPAT